MSSTMFSKARGFGARGFTLIELMITVAIVAVLAAIAFPSYQDSVWKSKRAEAKSAIFKALQAEERYYTQNNAYLAYPPLPAGYGSFPVFSADNAANSRYTLAAAPCAAGIASCVNVTATVYPAGGADPKCGATLSMDSVGNKSSAVADPICWK